MISTARAIETTGTVDRDRQLHLDAPVPIDGPSRVRIIILVPEDGDVGEAEWLRAAAASPTFDFLNEPEEDIYSPADGEPFHDEG